MALIHLKITPIEATAEIKAEILVNGASVDSKRLTNAEIDGLSDHIDFSHEQSLDAREVYRWMLEECWFDTNGEQTNLELLLEEYVGDVLAS